jgi:hypothetical protein
MDFINDHLFTADPEIIQNQILASKYKTEIISTVISKINQHVDDEYFTSYVGSVDDDDYSMYIKYLNSFYNDNKIDKMLYNETISNDDFTKLHNWFKMLYDGHVYFKSKKIALS